MNSFLCNVNFVFENKIRNMMMDEGLESFWGAFVVFEKGSKDMH